MKQTISKYQFIDEFKSWDTYKNHFSYEGLTALYDYMEELENDCEMEIELDVVAFCCDFMEYKNLNEFQKDYSKTYKTFEDIENETIVIYVDNDKMQLNKPFIIQQF